MLFYTIEFIKALQIRDYIFFLFLLSPLLFMYIFDKNVENIKESTIEYKTINNTETVSHLYNKTSNYYFRTPHKESCNLFTDYVVSFQPYQKEVDMYSCSQTMEWQKENVKINYKANGDEDKIKVAIFDYKVSMVNNPIFKSLLTEILKQNFKFSDITQIFNVKTDSIISLNGYEVTIKHKENQRFIEIR